MDRSRAADDRPPISVIVPVHDDAERLRACLHAIAAQTYSAELIDVVVVDNASSRDQSVALPSDDRFRMVTEARRGSYAARNTGVGHARGEVLAFTDADCLPRPTWLERAARRLSESGVDAVGGNIVLTYTGGRPVTGPEIYEARHDFLQRTYVEQWQFAATANLVVPRDVFEAVGPFDSALQSGGDLDWGRRLAASGRRLVYADDAVVDHPSRPSWHELRVKTLRVANGLADRDAGQTPRGSLVRTAGRQLRGGLTIWLKVWRQDVPGGPVARLRYAAAFAYVRVLRAVVNLRRSARR